MKTDLIDIVTRFIEIAWRRRTLLLLPVAIMLALSVLASRLLPQTYVAKALLVLQEQGSDNPLIKSGGNTDRTRERAPGLQALLKSDRVLVNSLRDILGERMPSDPRRIAFDVRELDSALSMEMIGADFLELQLKGSDRVGLGRKLEAVTARFLESLVASDQDSASAMQVLLEKRREDVANAEQALLRFKDQIGERAVAAIAANEMRLAQLQNGVQGMTSELAAIDGQIGALTNGLGTVAPAEKTGRREDDIREATAAAEAADKRQSPSSQTEAQMARGRAAQLAQLQALELRSATLRRDLAQTQTDVADLTRSSADGRSPEGQLKRLQRELLEARALMETYARRFPVTMAPRSLQVLNAPERIRVIDAPHDPEFPLSSRMRIIVGGTLLGLVLSVALAAAAEMFDQRLRHAADFEAAAGVPVLARLPSAKPDPKSAEPEQATEPEASPEPDGATPDHTIVTAHHVPFGRRTAA